MNPESDLTTAKSLTDRVDPVAFDMAQLQMVPGKFAIDEGGTLAHPKASLVADTDSLLPHRGMLHPKIHEDLTSQAASQTPGHTHRWEFVHVIGRRRAGLDQAEIDAINLKSAANIDYVDRISEDCHVGPHLEFFQFVAGASVKAAGKGFILKSGAEHFGPMAKWSGLASGIGLGVLGGGYFSYEMSELLENSCKVSNYEKRFAQAITSGKTTSDPDDEDTSPLAPLNLPYGFEKHFPSVRETIDIGRDGLSRAYYHIRGQEQPDSDLEIFKQVESKSMMDDKQFMEWAQKESAPTLSGLAMHHGGFLAVGGLGGLYVNHKLKLGLPSTSIFDEAGAFHFKLKSPWSAAVIGSALVGAFLLSELGVKAKQYTTLAELYTARLITKPHEHPNP